MNYIDLHVHSTASDGTLTPTQVVHEALSLGLSSIALTDHDTIDGVAEAMRAAEHHALLLEFYHYREVVALACGMDSSSPVTNEHLKEVYASGFLTKEELQRIHGSISSIRVIPGIEMSCIYDGTEIHILGYFLNMRSRRLRSDLDIFLQKREARNREILSRLTRDGIDISYDELLFDNPNTTITRAHFARLLVQKGYVSTMSQAFEKYMKYDGKYVPPKNIHYDEVMDMFARNHIWCSLAHPKLYGFSNKKLLELLEELKSKGLRGLEVMHSSISTGEVDKYMELASRLSLLPTGGSDYHGSNKPGLALGTGYGNVHVPSTFLDSMREDYRPMSSLL